MTVFRIGEAAELLGVSSDTVRRWVDAGRLVAERGDHGHRVIGGAVLAGFVRAQAAEPDGRLESSSARNRLRGIVTAVVRDTVTAQVDIQGRSVPGGVADEPGGGRRAWPAGGFRGRGSDQVDHGGGGAIHPGCGT